MPRVRQESSLHLIKDEVLEMAQSREISVSGLGVGHGKISLRRIFHLAGIAGSRRRDFAVLAAVLELEIIHWCGWMHNNRHLEAQPVLEPVDNRSLCAIHVEIVLTDNNS